MINSPKQWTPNNEYPNTYFAKAESYEQYFQLIKNLYCKVNKLLSFSCDQFRSEEHMFNYDRRMWHVAFESDCVRCDNNEYDDGKPLPLPSRYKGDIMIKPRESDYPCVVIYDNDMKTIMWQPFIKQSISFF